MSAEVPYSKMEEMPVQMKTRFTIDANAPIEWEALPVIIY